MTKVPRCCSSSPSLLQNTVAPSKEQPSTSRQQSCESLLSAYLTSMSEYSPKSIHAIDTFFFFFFQLWWSKNLLYISRNIWSHVRVSRSSGGVDDHRCAYGNQKCNGEVFVPPRSISCGRHLQLTWGFMVSDRGRDLLYLCLRFPSSCSWRGRSSAWRNPACVVWSWFTRRCRGSSNTAATTVPRSKNSLRNVENSSLDHSQ